MATSTNLEVKELEVKSNIYDIVSKGIVNQNNNSTEKHWRGTLAEYKEQDIENQHPDWICYITDDYNGSPEELGSILEALNSKMDVDPSFPGADYVIESQLPTEANGYTWYRKYKSGWVEQGGTLQSSNILPIEMSDTNYFIILGQSGSSSSASVGRSTWLVKNTTNFTASVVTSTDWQVSGMSA